MSLPSLTLIAVTAIPLGTTAWSSALIMLAVVALLFRRQKVSGTTLTGPWMWLQIALLSLLATQVAKLVGVFGSEATTTAWELLAAATTLCPIMSVLGAKRPQHRAWHFIVFSLWIVLVLPAGEVLLIHPGAQLRMHAVRRGFLAVLILLGLVNYGLTRFKLPVGLFALGQILVLGPLLAPQNGWGPGFDVGCSLLGLATVMACLNLPARGKQLTGWNRAWLDFRDAYGALWSIRVVERMNASARQFRWPVRFSWSGLYDTRGETEVVVTTLEPHVERSFRMLLRRFVDRHWYPTTPDKSLSNTA